MNKIVLGCHALDSLPHIDLEIPLNTEISLIDLLIFPSAMYKPLTPLKTLPKSIHQEKKHFHPPSKYGTTSTHSAPFLSNLRVRFP